MSAGLDELILFLKNGLKVTILVVTHELASAFESPTVAMLHSGSLIAVGSKDEFARDTHPRIRQFLDRQPDTVSGSAAQAFIESWLQR